jgi:predicted nucleotidyltransferase
MPAFVSTTFRRSPFRPNAKPVLCYNPGMSKSNRAKREPLVERIYWGPDIPMRVIRRYAREVAERFHPDKIILFGSFAYGTPHADSDVDILDFMPARNQLDQVDRIRAAVSAPFPLDVIVRTPYSMSWRLAERESFLTEITTQGKVLYEKNDRRVGGKGRGGPRQRRATESRHTAAP